MSDVIKIKIEHASGQKCEGITILAFKQPPPSGKSAHPRFMRISERNWHVDLFFTELPTSKFSDKVGLVLGSLGFENSQSAWKSLPQLNDDEVEEAFQPSTPFLEDDEARYD